MHITRTGNTLDVHMKCFQLCISCICSGSGVRKLSRIPITKQIQPEEEK